MKRKGKIRWGSLLNAVVGVVAVLGDPDMLGYLPAKVAGPVAFASVLVAAYKKAVVREEHERECHLFFASSKQQTKTRRQKMNSRSPAGRKRNPDARVLGILPALAVIALG